MNWSTGGSQEKTLTDLPLGISKKIINYTDTNGNGSIASISVYGDEENNTLTASSVVNETLIGNGGNDIYEFGRGDGQDMIQNGVAINNRVTGELHFGSGIRTNQIWLERVGNNLQLDIMGTQDHVTISDWFSNSVSKLQEIKTSNGNMLDSQVSKLVQVMATYTENHTEFDVTVVSLIPNDSFLMNAIVTAWHY